MIEDFINKL